HRSPKPQRPDAGFGPQKSKCNAILPEKALTISDSTDKWLNFLIFLSQHYISLHTRSLRSGNFSKIRGSDGRQASENRISRCPFCQRALCRLLTFIDFY